MNGQDLKVVGLVLNLSGLIPQPEYNGDVLEVWRKDERKPGREATSTELYLIVLFSMEISIVREESCGGRCTRPRTRGFSFSRLPHVF